MKHDEALTVGEYIQDLNVALKEKEARVLGEVSSCKIYGSSGHVYFTIKDKSGSGVMDAIMWKSVYALCGIEIEIGMEVIVSGHPNIYPSTGRLSFICDAVELVGEGALKKAYDELKKKLSREGLFDESRKRKIPKFVKNIGLITARDGAVIHDFKNNLGKFGFSVTFIDSRVEGQAALKDLMTAVSRMARENIEALVIIRGGGSLESLQAFNNEAFIREIVHFPVPVIAGIGHDQDVPLLALAADTMTSTPTAAAHLLNRSWEEAYAKIHQVPYILNRIGQEFARIRTDIDTAWSAMIDHSADRLTHLHEYIHHAEQVIRLNDPVRQLKLGYSIIRKNGVILRGTKEVKEGDEISVQLSDGSLLSRVEKII